MPFGTPIVVLSNPLKIEIVVDLLSTDAVKVKPGAPVIVENWAGQRPCAPGCGWWSPMASRKSPLSGSRSREPM